MMKKLLGIIIIFLCYSLPGFAKDIFAKCVYIGSSSANFELIEYKINTNDKTLFSSMIWKYPGEKKEEYHEYLNINTWSGTRITFSYPKYDGTIYSINYGTRIFFERELKNSYIHSKCTIAIKSKRRPKLKNKLQRY